MSRVIRLKEWGCNQKTFKRPNEKQIAVATSGLEDKDYVLNTDSNGFIINSLLGDRKERNKNIILLGDSFVESLFVDEDKRMNAVIEDLVPNANVLNGGYSGATSLHLINVIVNKVIPVNPDYVVIFLPTNDQRVQELENGYWNKDARLSPLVPLGKKSEIIDDYPSSLYLKSVEKVLKSIHSILDIFLIPHCFATTPHRHKLEEGDEWLNKIGASKKYYINKVQKRKAINSACRIFCKNYFINCVDLENEADSSELFYDDLHLINRYSPVVGTLLFEKLNRLGVF